MAQDKTAELDHAKKILHNPEFYWGSGTSAGERGSRRRADWIRERALQGEGLKVLEVGCGTGFFSEIFIQSPIELHSIDLSPDLLAKARDRFLTTAEPSAQRVNFRVCDIESLPYADGFFDAAVGVRVLHHLDMEAAFKEIRRVLKPGGKIAFCEPNMMNPQIMLQKNIPWLKKIMGDTPSETAFFKWSLKKFLESHGFVSVEIEPFDFLHPWIPKPLIKPAELVGRVAERLPLLKEIAGSLRIYAVRR